MCTLHYELCNMSNSLRIMDYAQCRTQYALSNLHCALCSISCILSYLVCTKLCGTGRGAKTENGKLPKGRGGVIYNPKIYVAYFWTLNGAFWALNWYKRVISVFRVCFFNNCIEKNQNKSHFEEGASESPSPPPLKCSGNSSALVTPSVIITM